MRLKINASNAIAMMCFQNWVDVCNALGGNIVIVCDKRDIEKKIRRQIIFGKSTVSFVKSRISKIDKIARSIADPFWYGAARAHLATFFDAQTKGIDSFWNIDADDTFFVASVSYVSHLMVCAEKAALDKGIDNFSFDMHTTFFSGKHWSFGITFCRNIQKSLRLCKSIPNKNWRYKFVDVCDLMNLDWYFTFLRDCGKLVNEVFYVDGVYFYHNIPQGRCLTCFKNGCQVSPFYFGTDVYKMPLAKDAILLNSNDFDLGRNENFDSKFLLLKGMLNIRRSVVSGHEDNAG